MAPSVLRRPSFYLLLLTAIALIWYLRTSSSRTPISDLGTVAAALPSIVLPHAILPSPKPKPRLLKWKPPPFQPLEPEFTVDNDGNGVYFRRIIAVGDIHGDLPHLTRILRHLELISLKNEWIGGRTVLVQTGDIVDRGKDTIALYRFFDILRPQAERAGGAIVNLLGNHELMNAMHDWRYVTPEDIASFGGERARMEAMTHGWIGKTWRANYSINARVPLAPYGLPVPSSLSIDYPATPKDEPTSLVYVRDPPSPRTAGDADPFRAAAISFVHGGIVPEYLGRLELEKDQTPISKINSIGSSILQSLVDDAVSPLQLPRTATPEQRLFWSENGPMWNREFALDEDEAAICERARRTCEKLGVRRLVMGHTPDFEEIRSRCDGMILLIDTGISRAYGGSLSALEIMTTYTPQTYMPAPPQPGPDEPPVTLKTPREKPSEPMTWLEREEVRAVYVGERRTSEILAEHERYINLPAE